MRLTRNSIVTNTHRLNHTVYLTISLRYPQHASLAGARHTQKNYAHTLDRFQDIKGAVYNIKLLSLCVHACSHTSNLGLETPKIVTVEVILVGRSEVFKFIIVFELGIVEAFALEVTKTAIVIKIDVTKASVKLCITIDMTVEITVVVRAHDGVTRLLPDTLAVLRRFAPRIPRRR